MIWDLKGTRQILRLGLRCHYGSPPHRGTAAFFEVSAKRESSVSNFASKCERNLTIPRFSFTRMETTSGPGYIDLGKRSLYSAPFASAAWAISESASQTR